MFVTSFSQAIGGQLVSIVWLAVIVWLKPYKNRGENVCSTIINVAVCVVMTGAVATKLTALQTVMRLYTDAFQDIIDRQFAITMSWTGLISGIVVILIGQIAEVKFGAWRDLVFGADGQPQPPALPHGGAAVHPAGDDAPAAPDLRAQLDEAMATIMRIQGELDAATTANIELRRELDAAKTDLNAAKATAAKRDRQIAAQKSTVAKLRSQLADETARVRQLRGELAANSEDAQHRASLYEA